MMCAHFSPSARMCAAKSPRVPPIETSPSATMRAFICGVRMMVGEAPGTRQEARVLRARERLADHSARGQEPFTTP